MSTIGELEQWAGIGSSPRERTTFWMQFQHLDGVEYLNGGVAELNRLIAEKEATPMPPSNATPTRSEWEKRPPLTAEEEQALLAYAISTAGGGCAS